MSETAATVGSEVRAARVEKGMALRELSRRIGKAPSYLSDIENSRRIPSEDVLSELCRVLELDLDRMLGLAGRFGANMDEYLRQAPRAGVLLRRAQERGLTDAELQTLIRQIDRIAEKRKVD